MRAITFAIVWRSGTPAQPAMNAALSSRRKGSDWGSLAMPQDPHPLPYARCTVGVVSPAGRRPVPQYLVACVCLPWSTRICQKAGHCRVFRDLLREELASCTSHRAMTFAPRLVSLVAKARRLEKCSTPLVSCVVVGPALPSASVHMVVERLATVAD